MKLQPIDRSARRALAIACSGLFMPASTNSVAQSAEIDSRGVLKINVTGTNIARIEGETGLPLQIITREELLNGGVQTMQELLDRISANQSFGGWNEAKGEGSTLVGFTSASLRGLGSQRTLVLLNGRRLAPYALSGGQSVDLSGIPPSAIERVEVLKDGASAVYGTDAIGGVINFILRSDYQGAEANANYYASEHGGGNNWRANATIGYGDLAKDKYNVFVSGDYFKQDSLKASQRESTKTAFIPALGVDRTSGAAFPANISQTDPTNSTVYGFSGSRNPTIPFPGGATSDSCAPPYSFPQLRQPFRCGFDFASVIDTIPESEKTSVFGRLTWQIDPSNQFFADGSYYRGTFTQRVSSTPVAGAQEGGLSIALPPASPYYPAAFVASLPRGDATQPIELAYRIVELGPRVDQAKAEQWNAVVGLQGTIKSWDYTLAANYTTNRQIDSYVSGSVYTSQFVPLLRSGVVNPFGRNTDTVLDLMRATQVIGPANDNRASNYGADFKISNTVYDLPAGAVAVAFGIDGRHESLEQMNSDFVVSGDVLGGAGAIPSIAPAYRTVWSMFGEMNVPIVKTLEANVAVRYDHYSDFGGTTNPKVTLRWQPTKKLLFRGTYGTGFRAPTLSDLFLPQTSTPNFDDPDHADPVRCPVTGEGSPDCQGVYQIRSGGNPALQPERSQQANVGLVIEPANGLSATFDYYWVKIKNVIETVPLETILGPDYARWTSYVVRKPPDAQYPDLPGAIDYVVQYQTNVGTITTSGIDINVQWRGPATSLGQFTLSVDGTYVLEYSHGGFESSLFPPGVGGRGPDGAIARYRQYAQVNWTYGSWGATVANTYQTGYNEPCLDLDPSGCSTRRVGSYSVWDVQGRYTGYKNMTLTLGIRNLLDTPPPVSNQGNNFQVGIDPTYADPRGRIFYGAIRYAFK